MGSRDAPSRRWAGPPLPPRRCCAAAGKPASAAPASHPRPSPRRAASSGATWRPGPRLPPRPGLTAPELSGRLAPASPTPAQLGRGRPARDPYGNRPPLWPGQGGAAAPRPPSRTRSPSLLRRKALGGCLGAREKLFWTWARVPARPSAGERRPARLQTPAGRGRRSSGTVCREDACAGSPSPHAACTTPCDNCDYSPVFSARL